MIQQFLAMIDKKIEENLYEEVHTIDVLRQLRSEVVKMDSGWIDAKDRLPAEKGDYIVKIKGRGVEVRYACVYFKDGGIEFQHDDVTHWQPLPPPPIK